MHRQLDIPRGDILIHAGDYTLFGDENHARDFNDWLGELDFQWKIVIGGNHEENPPWRENVKEILGNAIYLSQEEIVVDGIKIFGTQFFWPCRGTNPYYEQIPEDTDILVCHSPVLGYVDGGKGCPALSEKVKQLNLYAVISGHIHFARGIIKGTNDHSGTTFVNASIAGKDHQLHRTSAFILEI